MGLDYPPYNLPTLRWQALSAETASPLSQEAASTHIFTARTNLRNAIAQNRWLVEKDQRLTPPRTHLDGYEQHHILSLGDFVMKADQARDRDVRDSALGSDGSRLPLADAQLEEMKASGTLTVPSVHFDSQFHTWQVLPGFYSGKQTIAMSFQESLGKALDHLLMYTSDAVYKKNGRFPNLANAFIDGLRPTGRLLSESFGQLVCGRVRCRTYADDALDRILNEAERGYVLYNLASEGHNTHRLYDGLRLCSSDEVNEMWTALECDALYDAKYRPTNEWAQQEELANQKIWKATASFIAHRHGQKHSHAKLNGTKPSTSPKEAIQDFLAAERERIEASSSALIDYLENHCEGDMKELGLCEANRLRAAIIETVVQKENETELEKDIMQYKASLQEGHPILSLSRSWMMRRLEERRSETTSRLKSTYADQVTLQLEKQGLHVQSRARKLAGEFQQDFRESLARRLRSKLTPPPPIQFEALQLDPKNWTVLDGGGLKQTKTVYVHLDQPFWRLHQMWMVWVCHTKSFIGGSSHFLTSGPFSLRALLSSSSFYAIGHPALRERSLTMTLASRIHAFHDRLATTRRDFESKPDTGLIGKSVQRMILRLYLGVKLSIGTAWIFCFMTVGTTIATTASSLVLATAPGLAAVVALSYVLCNAIVFDSAINAPLNRSRPKGYRFIDSSGLPGATSPLFKLCIATPYYVLVPGVFQAVLATFRIVFFHPATAYMHLLWASARYSMRTFRDSVTWPIIRRYSRIPLTDTFLARRIHGPGLSATEYYRLPIEAVKVCVLCLLDQYRLRAHLKLRQAELEAPYERYKTLLQSALDGLGVNVVMSVQQPKAVSSRIANAAAQSTKLEQLWLEKANVNHGRGGGTAGNMWSTIAQAIRDGQPTHRSSFAHPKFLRDGHLFIKHQDDIETGSSQCSGGMASQSALQHTFSVIHTAVDAVYERNKSQGSTELNHMVNRAAKLLASFQLQVDLVDRRLAQAVAIPPGATGRFRMSCEDQQELWDFTQKAVALYGEQIQAEMDGILFASEFSKELRPNVEHIMASFYLQQPGEASVAHVAAFLLRQYLGGDSMLETLEETDEKLILSPKMSKEDEHLAFWRGFATDYCS